MSLNMPSPTKHRTTGTYYLIQRVPADLAEKARGQTLFLSVAGELCPVKAGIHVKVSLRTKEPGLAKLRYREADDSLQGHWGRLRSDEVELTHRQVLEIAGIIYADVVKQYDDDPGPADRWKEAIRALKFGRTPEPTTEESNASDVENRLRWEIARHLETAIEDFIDLALSNRALEITDHSRQRVRTETLVALEQAFADNMRKADGDYSRSPFADRFPAPAPIAKPLLRIGSGPKLTDLFDHWSKAQQQQGKSNSTTRRWKPIVASLVAFLGHDEASAVTDDDIIRWRADIIENKRSTPGTFNRNHIALVRVLYRQENGKVANCPDPTVGLRWRVAKPIQGRPKGFTTEEATAILQAANAALTAPGKTAETMRCESAWNKAPVFGVIGVQTGPL